MWIQVWNLPSHWLAKDAGFRFKKLFEDVMDVIIPESGSKRGRHMKILASVNLEKPLLRGTNIQCNGQSVWVDFRYKQISTFCYYCGRVGHLEKTYGPVSRFPLQQIKKIVEKEPTTEDNPLRVEAETGVQDNKVSRGEVSGEAIIQLLPISRENKVDRGQCGAYSIQEDNSQHTAKIITSTSNPELGPVDMDIRSRSLEKGQSIGCAGLVMVDQTENQQRDLGRIIDSPLVNIPIQEANNRLALQNIRGNVSVGNSNGKDGTEKS